MSITTDLRKRQIIKKGLAFCQEREIATFKKFYAKSPMQSVNSTINQLGTRRLDTVLRQIQRTIEDSISRKELFFLDTIIAEHGQYIIENWKQPFDEWCLFMETPEDSVGFEHLRLSKPKWGHNLDYEPVMYVPYDSFIEYYLRSI